MAWAGVSPNQCAQPQVTPASGAELEGYELAIAATGTTCKGVTHYLLRGCYYFPNCDSLDWDYTAHPPSWWPCPVP